MDGEQPTSPPAEKPKQTTGQKLKAFGKVFGLKELQGAFCLLIISGAGAILGYAGIQVNLGSGGTFAHVFSYGIGFSTLFIASLLVGVCGLIMFSTKFSNKIGTWLHIQQTLPAELQNKKTESTLKKFKLIPAIVTGAFSCIIVYIIVEVVFAITGYELLDLHSFINAYYTGGIINIIIVTVAIAVIGVVMAQVRKVYYGIGDREPEFFKKLHI